MWAILIFYNFASHKNMKLKSSPNGEGFSLRMMHQKWYCPLPSHARHRR